MKNKPMQIFDEYLQGTKFKSALGYMRLIRPKQNE